MRAAARERVVDAGGYDGLVRDCVTPDRVEVEVLIIALVVFAIGVTAFGAAWRILPTVVALSSLTRIDRAVWWTHEGGVGRRS